jgi:hypothetical protein
MPYTQTFGFSRTSSVVGGNAFQSPLNNNEVNTDPNADKDIIVQNNALAFFQNKELNREKDDSYGL